MQIRRMSTVASAALLVTVLAGCGTDEAPVTEPGGTSDAAPTTPDAPSEEAPTTEAPTESSAETTTEDAVTEDATDPGEATTGDDTTEPAAPPAVDLPTEASAYGQAFLQAFESGEGMSTYASPDAVAQLTPWTPWDGERWHLDSDEPGSEAGTTLLHYSTDGGVLLTLTLDDETVAAGGEQAIISADYSLGDYPIPDTVEDYANAFLSAVGTDDTEFALTLGPADGFAGAELWKDLTYGMVDVSDFGGGEDLVSVPFQEGGTLELTIDRAVAEAGEPHAITSVVFKQ